MPEPIGRRVEMLEETVNGPGGVLERLHDLQTDLSSFRGEFLQFTNETRSEFSAVRQEFTAVRHEIKAGDEETRRYMRVLHEEVLSRIARLQEGLTRGRKTSR